MRRAEWHRLRRTPPPVQSLAAARGGEAAAAGTVTKVLKCLSARTRAWSSSSPALLAPLLLLAFLALRVEVLLAPSSRPPVHLPQATAATALRPRRVRISRRRKARLRTVHCHVETQIRGTHLRPASRVPPLTTRYSPFNDSPRSPLSQHSCTVDFFGSSLWLMPIQVSPRRPIGTHLTLYDVVVRSANSRLASLGADVILGLLACPGR